MSYTPSDLGVHPALRTRFCELVGCRLPVVQTGMGWVSGASLTAATSAAGGFGILAAVTMTGEQLATAIAELIVAHCSLSETINSGVVMPVYGKA